MTEFGYALSSRGARPQRPRPLRQAGRGRRLRLRRSSPTTSTPGSTQQGQSPVRVVGDRRPSPQATSALRLGTGVTCPTVRIHPAIIAQAAATVGGHDARPVLPRRRQRREPQRAHPGRPLASRRRAPGDAGARPSRSSASSGRAATRAIDGTYYTVENARLYTLPDEPPPIILAAGGPTAAELAGRVADGLWAVSPKTELLDKFHEAGGSGAPLRAGHDVLGGGRERGQGDCARVVAQRRHRRRALPGASAPRHFEQAAKLVTADALAEKLLWDRIPTGTSRVSRPSWMPGTTTSTSTRSARTRTASSTSSSGSWPPASDQPAPGRAPTGRRKARPGRGRLGRCGHLADLHRLRAQSGGGPWRAAGAWSARRDTMAWSISSMRSSRGCHSSAGGRPRSTRASMDLLAPAARSPRGIARLTAEVLPHFGDLLSLWWEQAAASGPPSLQGILARLSTASQWCSVPTVLRPALRAVPESDAVAPAELTGASAADSSSGCTDPGAYVARSLAGEVILAPRMAAEFTGDTVPEGWTVTPWLEAGRAHWVTACSPWTAPASAATRSCSAHAHSEISATFAARPDQHAGFGTNFVDVPWVMFSTKWGRRLYGRTHLLGVHDTKLTGDWFDAPHCFRIDWNVLDIVFSVGATRVARLMVPMPGYMRALAANQRLGAQPLLIEWMRLSPWRAVGAVHLTGARRRYDGHLAQRQLGRRPARGDERGRARPLRRHGPSRAGVVGVEPGRPVGRCRGRHGAVPPVPRRSGHDQRLLDAGAPGGTAALLRRWVRPEGRRRGASSPAGPWDASDGAPGRARRDRRRSPGG
ncbi:MAG: hypothetical protein WKG07_45945 [Hymenobacter sp.]